MTGPTRGSKQRELRTARVRITAVAVISLLVVLGIAGLGVLRLFDYELMRRTDKRLQSAADYVADITAAGEEFPTNSGAIRLADLVQIIDDDGAVVFAGALLKDDPPIWQPGDPTLEPLTVAHTSQGELRAITIPFKDRWLVISEPLKPVQDNVRSLLNTMLLALAPLTLALGFLMWIVVGRTLRPVAASIEREDRLIADIGHELRSPLTGARVLLETEPADPAERAANHLAVLATLARLDTIAERLRLITSNSAQQAASAPVDLDELVLRETQLFARRTSIEIDTRRVVAGQVSGREGELESMIENLLTNATRHATSRVEVALSEDHDLVELVVSDDGPGIPTEERERVFERFTRLDEGRSRDLGGSGLGLSIVRSIAEAHGGTVELDDAELGGARFTVRLPASTPTDH